MDRLPSPLETTVKHYAGIDASLGSCSLSVVGESGKIFREGKVASEPVAVIAWFLSLGVAKMPAG